MRKRGRRETGPSSLVLLADHHTCQLPSSAPQVPRASWAPLAAVMEAGDTHSEPCLKPTARQGLRGTFVACQNTDRVPS